MDWLVLSTSEFDDWLSNVPADIRADVIAKIDLLREFGPRLRRPHADTLSGSKHANMKELRLNTSASVARVAYAFDPDRQAILLCAGDKSGVSQRKFYKSLIERADRLFDIHLATQRRRKDG